MNAGVDWELMADTSTSMALTTLYHCDLCLCRGACMSVCVCAGARACMGRHESAPLHVCAGAHVCVGVHVAVLCVHMGVHI